MIYNKLIEACEKQQKMFAVLIDPDKYNDDKLLDLANLANRSEVHFFFVGGSLMTSEKFEHTIEVLKSATEIPVIIFPGSNVQISKNADAILLLSLISGRNPEFLIGQHVVAAPYLKKANIEILSTGYMLIENEKTTTANYMSNTLPIPYDKDDIASCTAMAGEMLGLKLLYLDGGSGAGTTISESMIAEVKKHTSLPLIIGGGITSAEQAQRIWSSGANVVVVGNGIENDLSLVQAISHQLNTAI